MNNLIGQKFNKLIVISFSHKNKERHLIWNCLCECGKEKQTSGTNLRTNKVKSCGCLTNNGIGVKNATEALKLKTELKYKNYVGKEINKCLVLSYYKQNSHYKAKMKCFCGNYFDAYFSKLFSKITTNCGKNYLHNKPFIFNEDAIFSALFRRYKKNAKKRNINFELKIDIIKIITQQNCFHCGEKPNNNYKYEYNNSIKYFKYNGIDRFNNDIGYVEDNIVPCCKLCNRMKSDLPENIFLNQIQKIYNHNIDKL